MRKLLENGRTFNLSWMALFIFLNSPFICPAQELDESTAAAREWGYRPANGSVSKVTPPSFSWRPMDNMTWEIECAIDSAFNDRVYRVDGVEFNVHTPGKTFAPGHYYWGYRGMDEKGDKTNWSTIRHFEISDDVNRMPLPPKHELLARIPDRHPRLFVRPEELPRLSGLKTDKLNDIYQRLNAQCIEALENPPDVSEPPLYPEGMIRKSDEWTTIWWGNRMRVIKALNTAATLAFTRMIGGPQNYGMEAKRILMACAEWDPKGSTGYHYNDEAGMPYNYFFSRTYTFIIDLLTEDEKKKCREVMKIRGMEM